MILCIDKIQAHKLVRYTGVDHVNCHLSTRKNVINDLLEGRKRGESCFPLYPFCVHTNVMLARRDRAWHRRGKPPVSGRALLLLRKHAPLSRLKRDPSSSSRVAGVPYLRLISPALWYEA